MALDKRPAPWTKTRATIAVLNLLATLHIVWFYIYCVPSYLDLHRYEAGAERMPYQGRFLMQYPLRWAHSSGTFFRIARLFSYTTTDWLPRPVTSEDIMLAIVDLAAVLIAGLVTRDLYRRYSKTGFLTDFVYPFFLVVIACTYCLQGTAFFSYLYDLPSLGFFSLGLWLIYRKFHPALFAALFIVATINRETTLFLLYFFVASSCVLDSRIVWRRALTFRTIATTAPLAIFWIGWHIWIKRHFADLPSETASCVIRNFASMMFPLEWPQMAGIAGYTLPLILLFRTEIRHAELRLWLWSLPFWFAFMFYYGLLVEIRLFGELIPILACTAVLLAEYHLTKRFATPTR